MRATSLLKKGTTVTKGMKIGVLGTGYSSETDGERRHLHFGIIISPDVDVRGYVQTRAELSKWRNPLELYP